ncbi:MAG: dephospho-CoA kinase [Xanthomonadales bacterium]|nr:dephospho-CoA kinase [Xanthomonadales bacterium]
MSPRRPLVVALTGGVASGKSTVAAEFARLGAPVLDADEAARAVVAPGSEGLEAVVAAFGPGVLAADGALDRAALRRRVFADERERRRLEAILHPRIERHLREALAALAGRPAPPSYVVAVIPLLAEVGRYPWIDRVLVVDLPEAAQRERLMARDGIDATLAARMLAAQASREARLKLADETIDNSGPREALAARVAELDRRYRALAGGGTG